MVDVSKLKAVADDKINLIKSDFFLGKVENIVGKGENACNISPFPTMFSKDFF